MNRRKLTREIVEALGKPEREFVEWCGKLAGFGCRVQPSGSRTFIVQYRMKATGKLSKVTIGKFEADGGDWTVEAARIKARDVINDAHAKGKDEARARAAKRVELTVAELIDEYLEDGCDAKKASTKATDKAALNNHVKPLLGSKRIGDVTDKDFKAFMRDVERGKTRTEVNGRMIVRGGAGAARRTARVLSGVFSYAVAEKYLEKNPRSGVKIAKDNENERYLSEDELERLGASLHEAETIGLPWQLNEGANAKHRPKDAESRRELFSRHAVAAIRLLLATGMRSGEVLSLKWEYYDADNGFLYLPDSKTGRKIVVLSDFAREILNDVPRIEGNPYVIVGDAKDKPRSDLKRPWKRILAHAGLGKARLHDIRHTFASRAALDGMGLSVVGKLLGHRQAATTARYTHFAETALRTAANRVASPLADKIASRPSNVVPFERNVA